MTLDQLREKAENATPGPWEHVSGRDIVGEPYNAVVMERHPNGTIAKDAWFGDHDDEAAFVASFPPEVALALVEYVQANEAYDQAAAEAMHQDSAIYERAKAAFDDARARLFGLLGEAK